MRITNQTNQTPVNPSETSTPQAARADSTASAAPVAAPSTTAIPVQAYLLPSYELLSLNAILAQVPPVREDVLAATIRRLASGELRTPEAIARTASAILGG
jgi:hypothetical protein